MVSPAGGDRPEEDSILRDRIWIRSANDSCRQPRPKAETESTAPQERRRARRRRSSLAAPLWNIARSLNWRSGPRRPFLRALFLDSPYHPAGEAWAVKAEAPARRASRRLLEAGHPEQAADSAPVQRAKEARSTALLTRSSFC